jgi:LmbE family N-acetylglucosaminyl deacetylase
MSVLVIAAHPDDEMLGCGGTLARHAASGERVDVLFVADGETSRISGDSVGVSSRRMAARQASAIIGAQPPRFLDFPDNQLDTVSRLEIIQRIEAAVADLQPSIIYTHHAGDLNVDHQLVAAAAITAFRPQPGSTVRAIYAFEVLSSTGWAGPDSGFSPNRFVDIGAQFSTKIAALKCYDREMRPSPHARSYEAVGAMASFRGMICGMEAAEGFHIIRETVL